MCRSFCSLVLSLILFQTTLSLAHANEILVGTGEFPPFTTDTRPDQGCVIKIVKSAYEAEGWTVKLKFQPWPRNRVMLLKGRIEASAYWMDRPDRRKEYIFPENPVTSEVYRFVFRKDTKVEWESYEDLSGKTIIVNSGYTYNDEFHKALEDFNIKTHEVASKDLNLKMILKERADLTIMNESVYEQYFKELSEKQKSMLILDFKPAVINQGFLVFSRGDPERSQKLARVFDEGYEKIRERDDLKKFFETCGF